MHKEMILLLLLFLYDALLLTAYKTILLLCALKLRLGVLNYLYRNFKIAISHFNNFDLEEDEKEGLYEAVHGPAHEHHDQEDDAGHVAQDLPHPLHRVRVLR